MSASIFTTSFQSVVDLGFPLANLNAANGVFSPASVITPRSQQQVLPAGGMARAAMRVEDIYINSTAAHDLNLYYRPDSATAAGLPPALGPANNDTLVYSYAARVYTNPFHEVDDSDRRLKKLVFGQGSGAGVSSGVSFGGRGTLFFDVPEFEGIVRVTVHWSFVAPGGGIGT